MSKPRIVVTLSEGLIASVEYDGIDLSQVELICIDTDTEGCDPDADGLVELDGEDVWLSVGELTQLSVDDRRALDIATDADPRPDEVKVERLTNKYHCEACGESWEDEWCCACDDDCPTCGVSISPEDSEVEATFILTKGKEECPVCNETHDH